MLKHYRLQLLLALFALIVCTGTVQAANLLSASVSTVTLTCSTTAGPGVVVPVVIKASPALVSPATLTVTWTSSGGVAVPTPPASNVLNAANNTSGITFNFTLANGCAGVTHAATPAIQFATGSGSDISVTATTNLTSTATGLVASPTGTITLTCVYLGGGTGSASNYIPGAAVPVSITTTATGGTPFSIDTTTHTPPAGMTATPTGALTAAVATATKLSFVASGTCGAVTAGNSTTGSVHLLNTPAVDKIIPVTISVLSPSPLTAKVGTTTVSAASPAAVSYVKGSGTAGYVDVSFTASSALFFTLDTSTLPIWLTADSTSGTTTKSIRFSSTSVSDSLAPGTYGGTVHLKVSTYGDLYMPVSLLVTNPAPKLTLAEGTTRLINWTVGNPLPTPTITAVSSDSPIPYTITTGGTLKPTVAANLLQGLAYSFGTPIPVTFDQLAFAAAQPGTTLTGTVTLTWGASNSTVVVTFSVAVQSPSALITSITPATIPTSATPGQQFTVTVLGSGFVPGLDPTIKTKVGIVTSNVIATDANIGVTVQDQSKIILVFTVPATADAALPFDPTKAGGGVNLGVCNPVNGVCTAPATGGTITLQIGKIPIIQAVTSASSFQQVTPGSGLNPIVAPYDMVSIFGTNFCSSGGTGCSSSTVLQQATPDAITTFEYGTTLTPEPSVALATQRQLNVQFCTTAATPVCTAAPLLFATNSQINALVPSGVAVNSTVNIVVNFGYGAANATTLLTSAGFPVDVKKTDPGIFTIGADGQGNGAILASGTYALIGAGQPAGARSTQTDSDTVQIYMSGLGAPDSTADNSVAGASTDVWPANCVTPGSYLTSLNNGTGNNFGSLDGALIEVAYLMPSGYRAVPCFAALSPILPTVTIGGQNAPVTYAGWVPNSVAGLYQINAQLPATTALAANSGVFTTSTGASVATLTTAVQLPVVVTSNSLKSQSGVTMWVAPRLKVVGPSGASLSGTVGVAWDTSANRVTATEGTGHLAYTVTSGLLPNGLNLVTTGSSGSEVASITGQPAANTNGTFPITVTATDSAQPPLTGAANFTLQIGSGLVVTASGTPLSNTFPTSQSPLTTVTASGGTFPYTYTLTTPGSLPTGMTFNAGVINISNQFLAGTYTMVVHAVDNASTPVTGDAHFNIVQHLLVTAGAVVSVDHAAGGAVAAAPTVTGQSGTPTFSLDATSLGLGFLIDQSSGVVTLDASGTTSTTGNPYSVTITATDSTMPAGATAAGTGSVTISVTVT